MVEHTTPALRNAGANPRGTLQYVGIMDASAVQLCALGPMSSVGFSVKTSTFTAPSANVVSSSQIPCEGDSGDWLELR